MEHSYPQNQATEVYLRPLCHLVLPKLQWPLTVGHDFMVWKEEQRSIRLEDNAIHFPFCENAFVKNCTK